MQYKQTFFDWEEPFEPIENVDADIYVNDMLRISDLYLKKITAYRSHSNLLKVTMSTNQYLSSILLKCEEEAYGAKIEIRLKGRFLSPYGTIILSNATFGSQRAFFEDSFEADLTAHKIICISSRSKLILREWYGCCNRIRGHNGLTAKRSVEETITYRNNNQISYKIKYKHYNQDKYSFWVNMDSYKFKVSIIESVNSERDYEKYILEYSEKWGGIPSEEIREDIALFLSFIIGTKLIKFGASYFDASYISQKEFISPMPLDTCLLYQHNIPFFSDNYRRNDTDNVIKQIPKMLRRYFELKDNYRLSEVLSILIIHSYLNFNFISYVTYIEMFANINIKSNPTLIKKSRFKDILTRLNDVKGVPKIIKGKYQQLNTIGVGRKIQRLLTKYKIDYSIYRDVFNIRGKVVHGAYVDIQKMFLASEKAKELLTILVLKKLRYSGYIRDFTNHSKLIQIKDMSRIGISFSFNKEKSHNI